MLASALHPTFLAGRCGLARRSLATAMMRAVGFDAPGGAEVLRVGERARPSPSPGELLVEVAYAGVNRPDVAQRAGIYPPPKGATDILGLECSGRVAAVGEGVEGGWSVGDAVCGLAPGGAYAEFCTIPASHCLPIPAGMGMREAGGLPETMFTVWHNVFQRAGLRAGETLLVHGGSSGIGVTAIQLATALGSRVLVTAGTDDKCAACVDLGAVAAVNYKTTEDWAGALRDRPDGARVWGVHAGLRIFVHTSERWKRAGSGG